MAVRIVPDGKGGQRAEYIPMTGSYPGSQTGIKVDAAGNVIALGEAQVAELARLNDGTLPARPGELLPPAGVPDEVPSPEAGAQHALNLELQRIAVARQVSESKPDAELHQALDAMRVMQTVEAAAAEPVPAAQFAQREAAAVHLAAELGYVMAVIPQYTEQIVPLTGGPAYTRRVYGLVPVATVGTPAERFAYVDELHNIERRLAEDVAKLSYRASREAVQAQHAEQLPAVRILTEEQAYAESDAGRIAAVEADNVHLKALVQQLLAERDGVA